jgi:chorismate mutase-like protein
MTIEDWRSRIDAVDRKLVELLSERARHVVEVGKIKTRENKAVFDPDRERQILTNILRENQGPLDDDALRRIFELVITECRRIEQL